LERHIYLKPSAIFWNRWFLWLGIYPYISCHVKKARELSLKQIVSH
jgi:hypothetical protein